MSESLFLLVSVSFAHMLRPAKRQEVENGHFQPLLARARLTTIVPWRA